MPRYVPRVRGPGHVKGFTATPIPAAATAGLALTLSVDDTLAVADSAVLATSAVVADTDTVADTVAAGATATADDSLFNLSDSADMAVFAGKDDTATLTDAAAAAAAASLADSTAVTDQHASGPVVAAADTATVTDTADTASGVGRTLDLADAAAVDDTATTEHTPGVAPPAGSGGGGPSRLRAPLKPPPRLRKPRDYALNVSDSLYVRDAYTLTLDDTLTRLIEVEEEVTLLLV